MRLSIFPQDTVAAAFEELGGDTYSFTATDAVDTPVEHPTHVDMELISKSTRIGRIPVEALDLILAEKIGPQWWELDPAVLVQEVHRQGYDLDPAGSNKLMALRVLRAAPANKHPFFTTWMGYTYLTANLLGRPLNWGERDTPSPVECALSMLIGTQLRPLPFSDEVLSTVAACCLIHGLWVLPNILTMAQEHALLALRYDNTPITMKEVKAVQRRVLECSGKSDDDLPDPDEEGISERESIYRIQIIRCLDVAEKIEALHLMGQQAQDLVAESKEEKSS